MSIDMTPHCYYCGKALAPKFTEPRGPFSLVEYDYHDCPEGKKATQEAIAKEEEFENLKKRVAKLESDMRKVLAMYERC